MVGRNRGRGRGGMGVAKPVDSTMAQRLFPLGCQPPRKPTMTASDKTPAAPTQSSPKADASALAKAPHAKTPPAVTPADAAAAAAITAATGWLHTARFLTTAPELHFLPKLEVPEIAFVGRSNAGKSTCINVLTQQKQLAFASKKPGRTQHINLFALGKQGATDAVLADLPGYGYAAVPKADKIRWQQVMANYLVTRENLKGIVLMCDPRHGLTELDEILLDVVRPRVAAGLKFLVILTKADKLNRSEQTKALSIMKLQAGGGEVRLFSATKRIGVKDVSILLRSWI